MNIIMVVVVLKGANSAERNLIKNNRRNEMDCEICGKVVEGEMAIDPDKWIPKEGVLYICENCYKECIKQLNSSFSKIEEAKTAEAGKKEE
jgi:ribosome-binding protein aMBF1 (putative translation factor)